MLPLEPAQQGFVSEGVCVWFFFLFVCFLFFGGGGLE